MHAPPPAHANAPHVPSVNPSANYGFHNHGQPKMVSPVADYSNAGYNVPLVPALQTPYAHGYDQPYSPPASNPPHNGSHPHYQRNNQYAANNHVSFPPGLHQNGGLRHMQRPDAQMSAEAGAYPFRQGSYDAYLRYPSTDAGSYQRWEVGANQQHTFGEYQRGPVNQSTQRGREDHQQRDNHPHQRWQNQQQRGSHPQRSNQQYDRNQKHREHLQKRDNQQQRSNPYSVLDRKGNNRRPHPPVGNDRQ